MQAPTPLPCADRTESVPRPCAELFEVVYDDLLRLAHARLRGQGAGETMQPTALVHEAFVRVRRRGQPVAVDCADARVRFFTTTARVMRDILVENARRKARLKRGGGWRRVGTDTRIFDQNGAAGRLGGQLDMLALDDALEKLASFDPRKHEVVMLRFFVQLSQKEVAAVLRISERTVERDWRFARTWLHRQLF